MMDQLRGAARDAVMDSPASPSMSPNLGASTSSSIAAPYASGSNSNGASRLSPIPSSSSRMGRGPDTQYDDASSTSSSRAGSPEPDPSSSGLVVPSALSDAISAFSRAGARRADGRRGGLADQGFDVPSSRRVGGASGASSPEEELVPGGQERVGGVKRAALNPEDYPDTVAFREVDDALRRVRDEWPALVRGTSLAGQVEGDGEGEDDARDFDPVQLALHLLDSGGSAARRLSSDAGGGGGAGGGRQLSSFLRLKQQLDNAIRSTLNPALNPAPGAGAGGGADPYRAFESAITTHNATLQALSGAQKLIGGMRSTLGGTREKLEGKGREGLAGMYARLGMLEEMGGLLDEMCVTLSLSGPFCTSSSRLTRRAARVAPQRIAPPPSAVPRGPPRREALPERRRPPRPLRQGPAQARLARDWSARRLARVGCRAGRGASPVATFFLHCPLEKNKAHAGRSFCRTGRPRDPDRGAAQPPVPQVVLHRRPLEALHPRPDFACV